MRLAFLWAFGAMSLLGLASLQSEVQAGQKKKKTQSKHIHLHHALFELYDARHELRATKHNYGGHREKGVIAINDAIKQLEFCLLAVGDNVKPSPTKRDLQEHHKQYKHHPHLHHAAHELQHAHKQLQEAKHDFGGHRKAALRDVNYAIKQIHLMLKHHNG